MARQNLDAVVSVRFTDGEVLRLREVADEEGISVSRLIRRGALSQVARAGSGERAGGQVTVTGNPRAATVFIDSGTSQTYLSEQSPQVRPLK